MPQKKKVSGEIIRIPRTNVLMVGRLLLIQVVSILALLVVGTAIAAISESFGVITIVGIIILVGIVAMLDFMFSSAVYMEWKNKSYELRPEGVVYKRGVFFRREVTYPCNNIESITLRQGMLGQYFGYGTLRLYDPALQQTIEISNILNPDYYKQLLTKRYIVEDEDTASRVILG